MNKRWNEKSTVIRQWIKNIKHEKIVLVRNAKLNLDPGRGDYGDGGDRWSFARGRPLRMIIWKRPVTPDDHLQKAGPSGWSFARGWSLPMIICNMQYALSINKPTRDPRGPKIYVELNIYKKKWIMEIPQGKMMWNWTITKIHCRKLGCNANV